MDKIHYSWDDFTVDVERIKDIITDDKPNFVAIHRGSLPLGVKLSNMYNTPLSIIKFQSRDGNDKLPVIVVNEFPDKDGVIYVLDDIYDTGHTLNEVRKLLIAYKNIKFITLHNNRSVVKKYNMDVMSLNDTDGEWIVYPWE